MRWGCLFSQKPLGPVGPTIYRSGKTRLSLFAIIAPFGTPEDLALDDLKFELVFPADRETEKLPRDMANQRPINPQ